MTIESNLQTIRQKIAEYEKKYARPENAVTLLAASKMQSLEKMRAAIAAKQLAFGENYLQEAVTKQEALTDLTTAQNIEWHFIGPIQSNKTRKIAEHFSWVHSLDNLKIAKRLNEQRELHLPPLNICIEINLDNEANKSGVAPEACAQLIADCMDFTRLRIRGLMAIPAPQSTFAAQRAAFHELFLLWQSLRAKGYALDTLSMGMSDDFEAAIAEGATIVRIGTAIFGEREKENSS